MTKRSEALPLTLPAASATSNVITARALRRSLIPGLDPMAVARELADLAGNRRQPINQAITRIDRASAQRDSRVIERTRRSLLAALSLIAASGDRTAAA